MDGAVIFRHPKSISKNSVSISSFISSKGEENTSLQTAIVMKGNSATESDTEKDSCSSHPGDSEKELGGTTCLSER